MKHLQKKVYLLFVIIVFTTICSFAQERVSSTSSPLSAEDKRAIIALFQNAAGRYYKLQFNSGKEIYGSRTISSNDMTRIRNTSLREKGIIIICKESNAVAIHLMDGTILFIAASSRTVKNPILSLLGKEKTAKLKTLMARYIDDADIKRIDNEDLLGAPDT